MEKTWNWKQTPLRLLTGWIFLSLLPVLQITGLFYIFVNEFCCLRCLSVFSIGTLDLNTLRKQEVGQRGRNEEEAWLCNKSWTEQLQVMIPKRIQGMLHTQVLACLHTHTLNRETHTFSEAAAAVATRADDEGVRQTSGHAHTHISPPTTPSVFKWTTVELLVGRSVKLLRMEPSRSCVEGRWQTQGLCTVRARGPATFYQRGQRESQSCSVRWRTHSQTIRNLETVLWNNCNGNLLWI